MLEMLFGSRRAQVCRWLVAAVAVLPGALSLHANIYTWTGNSGPPTPYPQNNLWTNPGNWSLFTIITSSDTTDLVFGSSTHLNPVHDMGDDFKVHSLTFNGNYNLTGNSIRFDVPGSIQQNSGNATINNSIGWNSQVTYDGPGSLDLPGFIIGGGSLIKNGTGTLSVTDARISGPIQINAGKIKLNGGTALNRGPITLNVNDGLDFNSLGSVDIFSLSGSGSLNIGQSALNLHGGNFAGTITGTTGYLLKSINDLTLTGAGSAFDHLDVNSGKLTLGGGGSLTLTSSIQSLVVGSSGNAAMVVEGGAVLSTLGAAPAVVRGNNASITIRGAGSRWRAGNSTFIGEFGPAQLIVESGASITDANTISIGSPGGSSGLVQGGASVTAGTTLLAANGSPGTLAVSGTGSTWTTSFLQLGGGAATLIISNNGMVNATGPTGLLNPQNAITINGGRLITGNLSGAAGVINLTDPAGAAALTVGGAVADSTYGGAIGGSGSILKTGPGTQTLSGANTWSGSTTVNGGTLILPSANSSSYLVNVGVLNLGFGNFSFSSLAANPGGTIQYNYPVIVGGFLRGSGNHDIRNVTSFNGTSFGVDLQLSQPTPLTLNNVTNSGAFSSSAPLTWNGGSNSAAGLLSIDDTVNVSSFENTGQININGRGQLINSGSNFVSGGGGRINILKGGTLSLNESILQLNGSLLVNNGVVDGITYVNYGALAKGAGRYGEIIVTDGGKFSPGNSPGGVTTGSATWNSGGSYLVEIADALAGAGSGWDVWNINGALSINAGNTSNAKFTIFLSTMADLAVGFDPSRDYDWTILSASDGISGFDPAKFALNASGFKNDLHGGRFSIVNSGNDLFVHFASVPEPSISLILISTFLARFSGRRRR